MRRLASALACILALRRCPCTLSRFVRVRATFGLPDIGRTGRPDISGCLAPGSWLRLSGSFGLLDIGAGAAAGTFSMQAIGARTLDFMAALIMDLGTEESVSSADAGMAGSSRTTRP